MKKNSYQLTIHDRIVKDSVLVPIMFDKTILQYLYSKYFLTKTCVTLKKCQTFAFKNILCAV